ncbi:MAG: hypothetical protein H7Y86_12955 [Rhizobacter sp.]|nr:hypothetical protein [Ferruginibacter sp.]
MASIPVLFNFTEAGIVFKEGGWGITALCAKEPVVHNTTNKRIKKPGLFIELYFNEDKSLFIKKAPGKQGAYAIFC